MYTLRRTGVKGCIINYDKTSLIEVFGCMNDFDKCNCLITNIECCPADRVIYEIMDAEYCWIDGKELLRLLKKEDFQWIWGVFSVFPKAVRLSVCRWIYGVLEKSD